MSIYSCICRSSLTLSPALPLSILIFVFFIFSFGLLGPLITHLCPVASFVSFSCFTRLVLSFPP